MFLNSKKEYPLNELGYFTENQCEKIKRFMDGKTYLNFEVAYSNCAGNCTLIVKTNYKESEEFIKSMFIYAFMSYATDLM